MCLLAVKLLDTAKILRMRFYRLRAFQVCVNPMDVTFYGAKEPSTGGSVFELCIQLVYVVVPIDYEDDSFLRLRL